MPHSMNTQGSTAAHVLSDPAFVGTVFLPQYTGLLPPNVVPAAKRNITEYQIIPGQALQAGQLTNGLVLGTLLPNESLTVSISLCESLGLIGKPYTY